MRPALPIVSLAAALFLVMRCDRAEQTPALPQATQVTTQTEDGLELTCFLYPANTPGPPGLVLVHAMGSGPAQWEPFATRAQREGIMSVAIAMRGHANQSGHPDSYRQFTHADWMNVLKDIDAGMALLRKHGADPDNLAVVGASLGANLALQYALHHSDVQAVVMLSPGLDYEGVKTETAVDEYGRRPLLLVTSKGDAYSASSCTTLKARASGFCELREYDGAAHGTDILAASPNAIGQILLWLEGIIKPQPQGASRPGA